MVELTVKLWLLDKSINESVCALGDGVGVGLGGGGVLPTPSPPHPANKMQIASAVVLTE